MNSNTLLERLISLLNEERALYQSLLSTLQKERKAIIRSEIIRITECTKEKENLILKIRVLEEQRINYLDALATVLGISVDTLTLRELSRRVDESYATQLDDCSTGLGALIQSIQEVNASNKALVSHSLDLIRGSLSLLNDLISHTAVYYQTGRMQKTDQKGGMVFSKSA